MTDNVIEDPDRTMLSNTSGLSKPVIAMIILLVIIAIGVIVLYTTKDSGTQSVNAFSNSVSGSGLLSDHNDASYSSPDEYGSLSPSNQELLSSVPGLVTGQSKLQAQVSSLESSIDTLKQTLSDFSSEVNNTLHDNNETFNQLSRNAIETQTKITSLNNNVNSIGESVQALRKQITIKRKVESNPNTPKKSLPAFKLVNVQVWDSNPIAIVAHDKSQFSISVNEVLDGWLIKLISISGCMDVIKNKQSVKLCL